MLFTITVGWDHFRVWSVWVYLSSDEFVDVVSFLQVVEEQRTSWKKLLNGRYSCQVLRVEEKISRRNDDKVLSEFSGQVQVP